MKLAAKVILVWLALSLIVTWVNSAAWEHRSGGCAIVERKPSFSLSYTSERRCP